MRHYCTLFDSKYLPQGLALYESLLKHSSEPFTLYVLGMDQEAAQFMCNTPGHFVVASEWMLDMADIKANRSWQEYCWTCASNFAEYLFKTLDLPEVTYLDADCYFFSDPKVIFDEIGDCSIAVIPHRLIPSKKHLEINGKFNVSWVTFKNNEIGRECLSTWAAQCRQRCSATVGCGDQKYLDEWIRYGDDLCVIQNIGAGVAPWNVGQYAVSVGPRVNAVEIVFYHFHELRKRDGGTFQLTNYDLRQSDIEMIYEPYLEAYKRAEERIASVHIQA